MKVTFRRFTFLLLAPLTALKAADAPAPKTNMLLLVADDVATRFGCDGDKAAIPADLDRLASEGILNTLPQAVGAFRRALRHHAAAVQPLRPSRSKHRSTLSA